MECAWQHHLITSCAGVLSSWLLAVFSHLAPSFSFGHALLPSIGPHSKPWDRRQGQALDDNLQAKRRAAVQPRLTRKVTASKAASQGSSCPLAARPLVRRSNSESQGRPGRPGQRRFRADSGPSRSCSTSFWASLSGPLFVRKPHGRLKHHQHQHHDDPLALCHVTAIPVSDKEALGGSSHRK